ncbi:transmembrane protein [Thalictrum thalictroides]|uniref:Transmembrane protein n=1 Tax=Thalictrum thalictroides TaxID=46969 RepID=A0A7J6VSB1_THATH|nr:transmembrane protein [Thalictrum thalictroides]
MEVVLEILRYLCYFIIFIPVFIFLFLLGFIKVAIFFPFVFLVIVFGYTGVVIGLLPMHLIWTSYCIAKSKKFGPFMKCLLILFLPIPIVLWTIVGIVGCVIMGLFYAFIWPVIETFRAISKDGHANKLVRCITDGTWSNILGACTIVRDFADFSLYSYFSVMNELLESEGDEKPIELKVLQIPGCVLAATLGLLFDVPMIALIVMYKAPIMLVKGWKRLFEDLIGRSGPFLEDVCVPFAGLLILLWPFAVIIAILTGILSSFGFGGYASVVAYQENSTKSGLLYVIASVSLFDEYTNDFLYLREGSCFPRPRYHWTDDARSPLLPLKGLYEQIESVHDKQPTRIPSDKMKALKAVVIWDNFFRGCELSGKELLSDGVIQILDLEAWETSKNKIIEIGIPAHTILQCFLYSIKSSSSGFLMRDNVELTNINRPDGRIFDWLFEPMSIMKEQIKSLHLQEREELYLLKLAISCGDTQRLQALENSGIPPNNEIRKAQLEGISRRLHGFCLTISRLPTFRRRFCEVVKALLQEGQQHSSGYGSDNQIVSNV